VVQKHNLQYIQGIQKQIEELKPQAFAGENIKEYGKDVLQLAELLTNAGKYPQELTSAVIDMLLTAGGSAGHVGRTIFQADVIQFRQRFNEKCHSVSSIQYQSYTPSYTTASLSEMHKINRAPTKNKDSVTLQKCSYGYNCRLL
jgi:formyltetrahydrofolate synthetase